MHPRLAFTLVTGGALLVALAAILSPSVLERLLLGSVSGTLAWGPTLFRTLLAAHGLLLIGTGLTGLRRGGQEPAAAATTRQPDQPALGSTPWMPLLLMTVAALLLRLWRLDTCLWFDEVQTLVQFVRQPIGEILTSFPSQNQHMLFSLLAHASVASFGESPWTVRLPSVFFGVASLWALYLLGRRVVGTRDALLACALMTVSYHHVWFSQNARGYTGLLFFATLSTWLWLTARARDRWSWHLAYAGVTTLGMWTHMTMVFVPLSHAIIDVAETALRAANEPVLRSIGVAARRLRKPVCAWILAASMTLQLYALALPEFLREGLHEVSLDSEWTNPLWVLRESLRSLQIGFGGLTVVLAGILVAGASWLLIARRDWAAAVALVLPAMLGGASMLVLGHNLWPRFFFFAMGFFLLIAVHGAMTLPSLICQHIGGLARHPPLGRALGLAATVLLIIASAASLPRAYAFPKQDYAGARDFIQQERQPGDAVVAVGLAAFVYRNYLAPDWLVPETPQELDDIMRKHERIWLVYTLPVELKAYRPDMWQLVEREFRVVRVFPGTLGGGEVNVCRAKASG